MDYMNVALSLAQLALGQVSPNPAVGAVIVKDGAILGQGHTQPPGGDHAEVVALKQAGKEARGASLYVTLEPCGHYGRTPPCTQAIISAGIAEVHFAIIDPNPLVFGKGQAALERAGIRTIHGEHAQEASDINEAFITYIKTGRPLVAVKFAASLDGKIATCTGDSKWISGDLARKHVQHLRYISDAIMTGANTVIADDPRLTVRLSEKGGTTRKQPLRVVIDGLARTPPSSHIFSESGNNLLVVGRQAPIENKKALAAAGAELLELPLDEGAIDLNEVLKFLGQRQITSVLVEAGGILLGSLFDQGLVDKVIVFLAPMIIGGERAKAAVGGEGFKCLGDCARLTRLEVEKIGEDLMISGYVVK
jgi:diaminohydroxyphosphoribosylaminopyrimidine deaminase/5-amino-6-(5-phosphoribosylamino)uracil reductase